MAKDLHYLTDHYDKKIERIKEIGAPLNFIFLSDMHHRMHEMAYTDENPENPQPYESAVDAIESIRYILDRCPEISFIVSGGDIGNDYFRDPKKFRDSNQEVMDALYQLPVPVHCCVGNHDDGIGNATDRGDDTRVFGLSHQDMHNLCMKYNPTDENYYYVDMDTEERKYRFAFLNTSDRPYLVDEKGQYAYGWRLEISDKQAQWFEKEVLDTDRTVFVFSHAPLHNKGMFFMDFDDVINSPRIYYDIKHSKNVAMTVSGHIHYDCIVHDDDLLTVNTIGMVPQEWTASCPRREVGTETETAFDVMSIKGNVVYMTRFGAGEDRMAELLKV